MNQSELKADLVELHSMVTRIEKCQEFELSGKIANIIEKHCTMKQQYGYLNGKRMTPEFIGAGNELVPEGETETEEMEYFYLGRWTPNIGKCNGWTVDSYLESDFPYIAFRRKIKPRDGWQKIGEGGRNQHRAVYVGAADKRSELRSISIHTDEFLTSRGWTHWQYAELPAPPLHEKNPDEVAFDEWNKDLSNCNASARRAWFAALEYARKDAAK